MGGMKKDKLAEYVKQIKIDAKEGKGTSKLSDDIKKSMKGKAGVSSRVSGGMMGGGKKNYKATGMLNAKTGKLVGGQKNLPGHLKKAILA
jgi:hypothetical protein